MAKEIEKKFLLTKGASIPIPLQCVKYNIKQGYIHAEKDKQVRIRLSKWGGQEFANICVKFNSGIIRDEFEFDISNSIKEAKVLYKNCQLTLEKKRLSFVVGKEHYDIDTYPNGLVVVEVEFKSVKDMNKWSKNSWIGEEITSIKEYSNIELAKKNLKFRK